MAMQILNKMADKCQYQYYQFLFHIFLNYLISFP